MKFLFSFILLGLSGNAIGGGDSKCGPLQANYLVLLQASEYLIDETFNFANRTVYSSPFIGNSYINNLLCNLDLTINTMASGTSQFSGISSDYILGIFNGSVTPPFMYPLSCIEVELLSFYSYIQNLTENLIPEMQALVIPSPINETTPCTTVVEIQSQYFANGKGIGKTGIEVATTASIYFASVGLSDLYTNQINLSKECGKNILIDSLIEFYNMNSTIITAFYENQSISVPPPLSCTKGLIIAQIQGLNSLYEEIDNSISNASVPSSCDPFFNNFKAFKDVWFEYTNQLISNTINISIANPVLTPFFTADLLCEYNIMVMFAANATSSLSGVDSDVIYGILNGEISAPFSSPLDCIENDLIFMRNQISNLVNNIIPGFQNFAISSTSDTSTCNATYTSLTKYVIQLVDLLNMKGYSVSSGIALFASTNFNDLYLESFTSIIDCLPDLVGKYVGAALNANGNAVTAYVNGNRKSLPYPFSCAEILIDIIDSLLNQALVNFVTESPNNLVLPKIPKYRGK